MRISDWSSDVCSSDLNATAVGTVDGKVTEVTPPTTSDTGEKQVSYDTIDHVDQVVVDGAAYDYSYSTSGTKQTNTVTGPGSESETYVLEPGTPRPTAITNIPGQPTALQTTGDARRNQSDAPPKQYKK